MNEQELTSAIAYIRENFNPEEVFEDHELIAWAERCHTPDEVFPVRDLVLAIKVTKEP